MGFLFSEFKKRELVSDHSVAYEYFSPCTAFVVEHYLDNSPEYEDAIVSSMQGTFIAVKENRVEIAVDAFVDCVKALINWFKKWFKKFTNFVKEAFSKVDSYFFKGRIVIDRFLSKTPDFEPFMMKGYKYTIPSGHLNSELLYQYMDMVDEEIIQVLRADSTTLNPRIAKAKERIGSNKVMDLFRGILLNRQPLDGTVFKHELKHYFRNNTLKADILCNLRSVTGFCQEYKLLANQIDSIKKNKLSIDRHTNRILDFLEHEPERYYDGYGIGTSLDRMKNMGIAAVYSSANAIIKQINFMYDFYFSAKLDAINEALQFYVAAASKALGQAAFGFTIHKNYSAEEFIPDVDLSNEPVSDSTFFLDGTKSYELEMYTISLVKNADGTPVH